MFEILRGESVENPEKDGGRKDEKKDEDVDFSGIAETGGIITKNENITIHSMIIAGQIEGHYLLPSQTKTTKYEHMIPQLVGVEESSEIDGLLLLLNTVGGDVEAGLAIAELISGMSKPTVSLVLGGGHSIGVPLAVSTDMSFIVPSATMTLHPVRLNGLVIGVPQTFTNFLKMQERITNFIVKNSKADKSTINELIMKTDEIASDVGTVIDGVKAVEIGLIDRVGNLHDAISELKCMIERRKNG
ncbi:MAG: ATP-dependent Clp protease proteolytic subunit [Clostridia bacterium]|nr:ATP-dependent Clp protease proteolytic subunit [Clostridia bacterium]